MSASILNVRMLSAIVVVTAPAAFAEAPRIAPVVDRVVVFADRAEVTRVVVGHCEAGHASAVFEGLPEAVDPRTLRGDVDGDAVAVGVSTTHQELAESLDERVRTLRDELRGIDDRLALLERDASDDVERVRAMQSYTGYFRTLASEDLRAAKPDTSKWDDALATVESEETAAATRAVARKAEQRVLQRKRERIAVRLDRLAPAQAPSNLVATVAVQCGAQANPKVRLSYVVPGATWLPEYDLRFTTTKKASKSGAGAATLTVAGVVTQSSGEDWDNAEIWLSTAKPALGGEAPLPNPIFVQGRNDERTKTLVQAQEERAADLQASASTQNAPTQASLDDGGKAFVLKLPKRVTVRADGHPYWFPIDALDTHATSSLVAVPALSPRVFQVAALTNPAPYPLMAGRVHVFRGGTFVGNDALTYKAPGESMEVSLGIDDEIALERTDLMKKQREAGLFSGSKTVQHAWRTVLRNRSDVDVTLELREQIPVSKTADVTVRIDTDKTAPGYTLDDKRGHLTWTSTLKHGESVSRDLAFTIELPKDWKVQ